MLKKIISICLLMTCLTGCSFKPSLISEKRVIREIKENIPNVTHIETIYESNPQASEESTGMNIYLFSNEEFDFHVYNYLSQHIGTRNPTNQMYIEYDSALLTHLEPKIKDILTSCGFTYQLDQRTGHDKIHNNAVLIIHNTFTFDNPHLRFYTEKNRVDEDILTRTKDAVIQISELLEPYVTNGVNLPDTIALPISIATTKPDSLNPTLFQGIINLSKKHFEKDVKVWSKLTLQKANR